MTNNYSRNPYIIGSTIDDQKKFFGRESLFRFIQDNLNQDVKVILLHGQRRIGKSSVLKMIPQVVAQDRFVFMHFDLQDTSQLTLGDLLYRLATEIVDHFQIKEVQLPTVQELEKEPDILSINFLPNVYQQLDGKNLVLLLDEFDVFGNENHKLLADQQFFPYLQSLIKKQERLFIIPVVGRNPSDIPKLLGLFGSPPTQEISFLDKLSAERLITKPSKGLLEYEQDAQQAIIKLSAGHPYFIQIICFALFGRARELNYWKVSREDVEGIVDKAIESAQAGLAWFWDGLTIPEQVVLSSVAEAQKIADRQFPEHPLTLLKNYGVIQTEPLIQAAKQIVTKGFLDDTERRVKVELVRRWLVKCYPLRKAIWELEKLEPEAEVNRLLEEATRLYEQNEKQKALAIYEQVLVLNPNRFSALFLAAEGYLEAENFSKAVEFHTRAYKVDSERHKKGLLDALLSYGNNLIMQGEFKQAQQQFNEVLKVDPGNKSAQEKLHWKCTGYKDDRHAPISVRLEDTCPECDRGPNSKEYSKRRRKQILLGAAVGSIALVSVGVGVGVYSWSTSCFAGEQRVLGISCPEPGKISHGERILFPRVSNSNLSSGTKAFEKGNYPEAVQFFKTALADNLNDPEVMIYYNNARARQQDNPLTLAVVVPIGNAADSAQEVLRGVAQAQNQFNDSRKPNERFLEIAIANDNNDKAKAKQVAQELVKDKSILGVIGHGSSEPSMAALDEYKKADLAMLSSTSTSTKLSGNNFFRTVPSDEAFGKKLAECVKNHLHIDKVVIFDNPASAYSSSLVQAFRKNFEQLGGSVVRDVDLTYPDLNLQAKEVELSVYEDHAKAALLFPDANTTTAALKIAKDNIELIAKKSNYRGLKLLGGDILYSQKTLEAGGKDVEGLILAVPWFSGQAPQSKNFSKAAEQQWKGQVSWRTATSFDATQALIKALSDDNPSRSTVLQRLRQVKLSSTETSGQTLQFTPQGERTSEPILVEAVKGKFELVEK